MKISYNWLKSHLTTNVDLNTISEILTSTGLEVEGTEKTGKNPDSLNGVLVGKVVTLEPHPNADKLRVASVDLGQKSLSQIVCGAPNIAVGQFVPVATPGTTVSDKKGQTITIKEAELRGVKSSGMICSEAELGLSDANDGIYVFDKEVVVGESVSKYFDLEEDELIEIGLTPNRADAMSHFGVARDLYAALKVRKLKAELGNPFSTEFPEKIPGKEKIEFEVKNVELAPRYAGISLKNIQVKPSPAWLQNRLKTIGLSPINNVVDITNFILHDLGQPLHAFDADKISGQKIIVQTLPEGTKFTTLDGVERTLKGHELMICDEKKPLCMAGVFGGKDSGITENTTNIFLESAYFNPVTIRKGAKAHGLNTDASFRFERGIDPNITVEALKKAVVLLMEYANAEIAGEIQDLYPNPIKNFDVVLRYRKIDQLIGERIHRQKIKEILGLLDIEVKSDINEVLDVTVPAYRVDVQREVDLIEDILRIYGYNQIQTPEKVNFSIVHEEGLNKEKIEDVVARLLNGFGFHEAMNNSMTTLEKIELSANLSDGEVVKVLNPLSSDLEVMRTTLVPGLLENVAYNINRRNTDIKLFEFGKTYGLSDKKYIENKYLTLVLSGNYSSENWISKTRKTSFFDLKGYLNQIFERLNVSIDKEVPSNSSDFSEGIDLFHNNQLIGSLGKINKSLTKKTDVNQEVWLANLHWNVILDILSNQKLQYKEISKFPGSRRDLALLIDEKVSYEALYEASFGLKNTLLKSVNLFDVYEGENLPKGKKSYALSFYIQDEEKTLNDKVIDKLMQDLIKTFKKDFEVELR